MIPVSSGDFLLKAEYKTGKMLDTMKIEEIIQTLGEMNEVINEVDPTEKIIEFVSSAGLRILIAAKSQNQLELFLLNRMLAPHHN